VRTPSGIVALAERPRGTFEALFQEAPSLVLIAVDVQDPGNVGAVVRACEAACATGVIFCGACADPFGWKALRGSMGSAFRLPVAERTDAIEAIGLVRARRLRTIAAVPGGGEPLFEVEAKGPVAFVLGGEGSGLHPDVVAAADARVSIPMRRPVESLNVAVAAALLVYEAFRQRSSRPRRLP
jgi:RNA methyltransferase, TrmH family